MIRVGVGYDVHATALGRKLVLCGVEIRHARGLAGHSAAAVALGALAAAGDGGDQAGAGVDGKRGGNQGQFRQPRIGD